MTWQLQPDSLALLVGGVLSLILVITTWPRRYTPTGLSFIILTMAVCIWSFGEFIQLGVQTTAGRVFWLGVNFIGISVVPPSFLAFTLYYTGRGRRLTRPILIALIASSSWQSIAVWTTPWHGLFFSDIDLEFITRGPLFLLNAVISYLIILGSIIILLRLHQRSPQYRPQIRMLLVVVLLPSIANVIFVLRIFPFDFSVDLTPLTFAICIFVLSSRIFRGGLFDILPVAHREIFYSLSGPIIVVDLHNNIIDLNTAALKDTGKRQNDCLHQPISTIFPVLKDSLHNTKAEAIFHTEVDWLGEEERVYDVLINPMYDQRKTLRGRVILLHDLTRQKRTERALREQYEMTQDLVQKHKAALYTADLANQTKDKFLANMSHELRTPLNAILGYTELVVDDAVDNQYDDILPDLNKIQESGYHLLGIITRILDLTKMETQNFHLYFEPFPINALFGELEREVTPLFQRQANIFEIEYARNLPDVYGDERRTYQILLNILNNAGKFTHNGRVSLQIQSEKTDGKDWVVCTIRDNGIGIPSEKLSTIFQPFSQGDDSATREYQGVGIGLTISQQLCEMMGGHIEIESAEDRGTTVKVFFPAYKGSNYMPTQLTNPLVSLDNP